jgi:hypothetical protein
MPLLCRNGLGWKGLGELEWKCRDEKKIRGYLGLEFRQAQC